MKQRVITATIFTAVMLCGIYGDKYSFFGLFLLITGGTLWELFGLLWPEADAQRRLRRILGTVAGMLPLLLVAQFKTFHFLPGSVVIVLTLLAYLFPFALFLVELYLAAKEPFRNIAYYLLGIVYVGIPYSLLAIIATEHGYQPHRVFGLLWLVWTSDTMAYLIGSRIGKTKLFERISPNKTWEGTIGGIICAILMAWALSFWITDYTTAQWIALGGVAGVFGAFGDLIESMFKRSIGVKDSGALLPGHGGLLDRFDAFMFMLPFAWVVLELLR